MTQFYPLDIETIRHIRAGGDDIHGQPAERAVSDGQGKPCRCCLNQTPKGEPFLIFAARPFPAAQPYAETGPVFLCANDCVPWADAGMPPNLTTSPTYLIKGYSADHRIVYGTGQITPNSDVASYVDVLLTQDGIDFVDIRSASNNCFLARARA